MGYLDRDINMKSEAIFIVSYFEKDENDRLQKVDQKEIRCTKKELLESLKGTKLTVEYVKERPVRFQMGKIYVLNTPKGRPDYIYTHQING